MFSKLARFKYSMVQLVIPRNRVLVRKYGSMIPATQYDIPLPKRLFPTYFLVHYWELWPLVICTMLGCTFCFLSIMWACCNKVDVVFKTHTRASISRTMNLRCPTVHKIVTISQKYEPWPEMQDALDKLREAEHRALTRAKICP